MPSKLSLFDAMAAFKNFYPEASILSWTIYHNLYLFRVRRFEVGEEDWDPFFSVNIADGEVREFSVLADGNLNDIANSGWKEV